MIFLAATGEMCFGFFNGSCKTNNARDILSTTAQATLLTTANTERMQRDAVREIESPDAFRTATFRSVQGQEVNAEASDIDVEKVESLRGVRMEVKGRSDSLL